MPRMKQPKPTSPVPQEKRKAWNPPCSPEEMAGIVANLRTLATMDASLDRTRPPGVDLWPATTPVRKLVASVDESLAHVNGRFHWGQDTAGLPFDAHPRSLSASEVPLGAVMQAVLDLVLSIRLGVAPLDCGTKLHTLADEIETRFNELYKSETPGKPLTRRAMIIKNKLLSLEPGEAMKLPQIQDWYETKAVLPPDTPQSLDEGTWKRVRKELLPYGLEHRPNVGYYFRK